MSELKVKAMAAMEKKGELKEWEYTAKPLGKNDVEFKVTHCGVCHSDIHQIDSDWGPNYYPLVPGHEVVGTVAAVGENVKNVKVGDTVGLGAQCDSCHDCEYCNDGNEQLCDKVAFTYAAEVEDETGKHKHYGGFSNGLRTPSEFVVKVPDNYPAKYAGPLFCAGVTVYRPLKKFNVTKGSRVAIVGVGGLGHMGVQFAAKMGATVAAVSRSEDKEKLAAELGATEFVNSGKKEDMDKAAGSFDFVLITISANLDFNPFIALAKKGGVICFVGLPPKPIEVPLFSLAVGDKILTGSLIGSIKDLQDMANFAAEHDIKPIIEEFKLSEVNEAVKKVRENTIRFRAVLHCE